MLIIIRTRTMPQEFRGRIILSGLTACGKSTHGRLLAECYEIDYVGMRGVMSAVLEERQLRDQLGGGEWTPETDAARAEDDQVDLIADRRMVEAIEAQFGVFDAWLLPWLYRGSDAIRIWLEASVESRAERCHVSAVMRGLDPPEDPRRLITQKDDFSRSRFRRLYGIDFGPDPDVFDLVVENSAPMPGLGVEDAAGDIEAFNRVLRKAIDETLQLPS